MDTPYLAPLVLKRQRPDSPSLWAHARQRIEQLMDFLGSPVRFARIATLDRREHREMNIMIAPLEYLVRALLMAEAIAMLVCTEEGAALMRAANEARDAPAPPPPRATVPARVRTETGSPAQTRDADAIIARALDPKRLAFRLIDAPMAPAPQTKAAPRPSSAPPRAISIKPPESKLNHGIRYARRLESLRLILANPNPMILILARHLAGRILPPVEIASPHKPMPHAIACQGREIILARALSFARALFFQQHRQRIFKRALPPPRPG
ncbi:MAG: hypothetical protein B7Y90_12560 [Alphaproteobacteria bacterium 32-64-14]|nr:MAG: hypothetical protein B7Y90_12560 [Alphaproteobacteria bacterium 32-64-14]